jgi:nucleoside 2-deoxyribosyltransferase
MKVFIAGPLFSQAEQEFNLKLDEFLRKQGFETFLPQREVGELWRRIRKRGHKAYRMIYEEDLRGLEEADVVVAILDGTDVDSGTAFEVGYACARGKPVIGLKTDTRVFAKEEELNNMIAQGVRGLAKNFDELLAKLKKLQIPSRT